MWGLEYAHHGGCSELGHELSGAEPFPNPVLDTLPYGFCYHGCQAVGEARMTQPMSAVSDAQIRSERGKRSVSSHHRGSLGLHTGV